MKKTIVAFASVAMLVCASSAANATLVAYWNFNSFDPATDTTIPADQGVGTVDLSGWGGGVASFAGTTINALGGDPSGGSLSLQGGGTSDPFPGNDTYIEVQFSMAGLMDLEVTFATRGTSTGFDTGQWSYSTDGASFTNFGVNTATRSTSFALAPLVGTDGLDNASSAFLRYTLSGAESSGGNNRIDNLQLNATVIPEPAGIVLMMVGLAAVGAMRRRS